MKYDMHLDLNKMDPVIAKRIIEELEEKGFYHNGSIVCNDEQGKEVTDILDKYLLKK